MAARPLMFRLFETFDWVELKCLFLQILHPLSLLFQFVCLLCQEFSCERFFCKNKNNISPGKYWSIFGGWSFKFWTLVEKGSCKRLSKLLKLKFRKIERKKELNRASYYLLALALHFPGRTCAHSGRRGWWFQNLGQFLIQSKKR